MRQSSGLAWHGRPRGVLGGLVGLGLVAGVCLVGAHALAPYWWFAELFTHGTPVACVGAVALVVLALMARWRAAVALSVAILAVFSGVWATDSGSPSVVEGADARLRLAVANVRGDNAAVADVRRALVEQDPAIVGVVELRGALVRELGSERGRWPYRHEWPREDNFGMGLYSRFPFVGEPEVLFLGGSPVPVIVANVQVTSDRVVQVSVVHTYPPIGGVHAAERDGLLEVLGARVGALEGVPFIVGGDLNLTPWSPVWHRLMADSGAVDSRWGHGHQGTWPAGAGWLMLPIDHVLTSPDIWTEARDTFELPGSDHRGVVVDLRL